MNKKKLTIKETFAQAFHNHQQNNLQVAEKLYKEILKINPNHPESAFYLGALAIQTRRFNLAKQLYEKVVFLRPDYAEAHNNLGSVLRELGEYEEAVICYEKAIQIHPQYAVAHSNLGAVLLELGKYMEAAKCCEKAIQIQSNLITAHSNLGLIFRELGDTQKAINHYLKLSQMLPNSPRPHQNLARLYVMLGDIQKAIGSYQEAVKNEPGNLFNYYHLSKLKKEILDSNLKNKINKILKEDTTPKRNLAYANFLLSSYEFQKKNYEEEFNYLLKGHNYYFESEKEKFEKEVDYWLNILPMIKELTNLNNLNKNVKKVNGTIKPIFIIGVPRCGSTLVERIIASGMKYIPIGEETGILSTFVKKKIIKKHSLDSGIENFQIELFEKFKQKGLIKKNNDYTFTDKTLDNFFYIGLIKQIFPDAKVVNCKRNALSSIVSILKSNLPAVSWAHNLEHIFKYFDIYYRTIENYKKIFPNFIYELQYEKLVNDPEEESKKLLGFCDLPWDKKCLEFYKRKDLISKTSSTTQIRKAIYKDSTQKYLPYKQFIKKYGDRYHWYHQLTYE